MTQNNRSWTPVFIWISLIYLSIPWARPITDFCKKSFPFLNFATVIAVAFFAFILWLIFTRISLKRISSRLSLGMLIAAYAYMLTVIQIPEEKIHFIEYSVLSFFIFRALQENRSALLCYCLALILTSLAGWIDEGIQYLTPGRYYDNRDVLFNAIGGMLGLIFVFILRSGGRKDLRSL